MESQEVTVLLLDDVLDVRERGVIVAAHILEGVRVPVGATVTIERDGLPVLSGQIAGRPMHMLMPGRDWFMLRGVGKPDFESVARITLRRATC